MRDGISVGMTSNGFTLADPNDRGMPDVVGFDTTVPAVIADFVRSYPSGLPLPPRERFKDAEKQTTRAEG